MLQAITVVGQKLFINQVVECIFTLPGFENNVWTGGDPNVTLNKTNEYRNLKNLQESKISTLRTSTTQFQSRNNLSILE